MNIIQFYKINESYGFFSNFAPYPILIENEIWKTVEHYFQASKFVDENVRLKIKKLDSPMQAANEGRNRKNTLRNDWEDVKERIMYKALLYKFLQHPKLRKELILTGDSTLVEHTQNDKYWADGGDGTGENRLGILLMKVRDVVKEHSDNPDLVLPPWIAFPSVNQNDLFWGMGIGEDYFTQWARFYVESNKELYKKIFPVNEEWGDIYE